MKGREERLVVSENSEMAALKKIAEVEESGVKGLELVAEGRVPLLEGEKILQRRRKGFRHWPCWNC